jgi:hypothetical protein
MRPCTTPSAISVFEEAIWLTLHVSQERPCARCIKRNIGHLCHDERRETDPATKKAKAQHSNSVEDEEATQELSRPSTQNGMNNPFEQRHDQAQVGLGAPAIAQGGPLQIVQPSPVSGIQANTLSSSVNHCMYQKPQYPTSLITTSRWLSERLARITKPVPGHAQLSSVIHVQRTRSYKRVQFAQ